MKSQYNQYPYYNDYSNIAAPVPEPENIGTTPQNLTNTERLYKFDSIIKKYFTFICCFGCVGLNGSEVFIHKAFCSLYIVNNLSVSIVNFIASY